VDSLSLSESLSFSLFALMLAGWVVLLTDGWLKNRRLMWWFCLITTVLITVLFSFIRDSNVYFALAGGVILCLVGWVSPQFKNYKWELSTYALAVVMILVVQNLSLSGGNRWQIFIYDHLAMRILRDPEALTYFEDRGLPVTETLIKTTRMAGFEYQKLLIEAPEMQPVRDWVECCGKNTYAAYLMFNPAKTLWEPVQNYPRLLNGDNLEYRNPRYEVKPLPDHLAGFNMLFFNHQGWVLVVLIILELGGLLFYFFHQRQPLWLVLSILIISIYPMMFLVWHAEPLEIERHAAQIGVQFRLAGWLSLFLWLSDGLKWLQLKIIKIKPPIFPFYD
ncbi:MAG: hypothetical protein LWX83_19895, partial [Anaerolineae bacterium]|nr:hypothetical protein [Anaerolineae bacterium]